MKFRGKQNSVHKEERKQSLSDSTASSPLTPNVLLLMLPPPPTQPPSDSDYINYYCSGKYQNIERLIAKFGHSLKIRKSSEEFRLIHKRELRKKSIKKIKKHSTK